VLARTYPERAERLLRLAQADVDERWRYYRQLGAMERTLAHDPVGPDDDPLATTDEAGV
jgi:pyruvate-ferredoxin/flavodoxin oxidoreductase